MQHITIEACDSGVRLLCTKQSESAPTPIAVVFSSAQLAAARTWAATGAWSDPAGSPGPIAFDYTGEGLRIMQTRNVNGRQEARPVILKGAQIAAFKDWLGLVAPPTPYLLES
jgi:hypothetical protein